MKKLKNEKLVKRETKQKRNSNETQQHSQVAEL